MSEPNETERITALERAFRQYTNRVPGLGVDVVGTVAGSDSWVHPVAGFQVRLERDDARAGVSLYVSSSYGELRRWAEERPSADRPGRESFDVRLREGYGWGDSEFDDPAELAHDLLAYMQYNLDSIGG